MSRPIDRELGMERPMTRRDFLDGVGLALTGSAGYLWAEARADSPKLDPEQQPDYYPPARTGLRGSHEGSWEVGHALREGKRWKDAGDTGEAYDLVVVGGGISGLAAAYFYRKAVGPGARILILENHDDFGGHAKRNEFRHGDRTLIGYGGTQSIEGPSRYSKVAKGLLADLGIDVTKFYKAFDQKLYDSLGLHSGDFFDKENFGVDRLVVNEDGRPGRGSRDDQSARRRFLAKAPFNERAKADFIRLHEDSVDYLAGLSRRQKRERLRATSYADFLRDDVKVDPQVIAYFQQRTHGVTGVGIDAISALELLDLPGFQGMGIAYLKEEEGDAEIREPYIFHFPDGNASIARLLVRALVPSVAPGNTMEDVVTARFNYARLDEPESPARIRLNSTVVSARHTGLPEQSREVLVTYVRHGKAYRVRARNCVLACFHSIIPYLCPELPDRQRKALAEGVRVPLIYVNVLLRDWTAFQKLGVNRIYGLNSYFSAVSLDFPVSLGEYHHPRSPTEPIVLHLQRVPCKLGLPKRTQNKVGRHELVTTTFETFEREIRDQLRRMLSSGGFDPARDIEAITVNRWPHGYADENDMLTDPYWPNEEDEPWVIARKRFGRIAIANSDAARRAYTDAAIDEAHRAVRELLARA
jgi:spermidine dehydrogenase